MIEYISYLLCTISAYWLYTSKPWKESLNKKLLSYVAFGLVFSPFFGRVAMVWPDLIWKPLMLSVMIGLLFRLYSHVIKRFGLHSTKSSDEFKSGVRKVSVDELNAQILKIKGDSGPMIGEVKTKLDFFSTHLNLIGSTGSGKSLILRGIIEHVRKNNQKAIMIDPGAEFLQYFYKEGDKILNPRDSRGEDWSLFAEMRAESDAIRITKSLIPDGIGSSKTWNGYAQTALCETIRQIFSGKSSWVDSEGGVQKDKWLGTNGELFQRLNIDSNDLSAARMKGTGAGKLMAGAGEMVSSFMGIIGQHINPFSVMNPNAGKDAFSIRNWIEDENQTGILWVTYNFDDLEYLKPILAMWVDIASTSILSLPTNRDRKIWFLADEFPVLGPVNSVEMLLTNGRKKGANVVLASQTFSQWVQTYGENKAVTFLGNMKAWCIFASPELKTREYLSNSIGKQTVDTKTYSGGNGKGSSWSKNTTERQVVTASEIKTLAPRHFYVSFPGDLPIAETVAPLPPTSYVQIAPAFVYKDQSSAESEEDVVVVEKNFDVNPIKTDDPEPVSNEEGGSGAKVKEDKPDEFNPNDFPFDINAYSTEPKTKDDDSETDEEEAENYEELLSALLSEEVLPSTNKKDHSDDSDSQKIA
jgi:type IV secretion system coupling TraD/TrwB family protein